VATYIEKPDLFLALRVVSLAHASDVLMSGGVNVVTTTLVSVLYGCSVILAKETVASAASALNAAIKTHRNAVPETKAEAFAEDKKLIVAQRTYEAAMQAEIRALNDYFNATSSSVIRAVRA
jgi:hypothetical protein